MSDVTILPTPPVGGAHRRHSPAFWPVAPRNKGMEYPTDPPRAEEIVRVMRQAGRDRHGLRIRAQSRCSGAAACGSPKPSRSARSTSTRPRLSAGAPRQRHKRREAGIDPFGLAEVVAHQVRAEFAYAGGGIGRGGQVTLYVDGEAAGSGEVKRTHPLYFSFNEGMDVGVDTGMPVFEHYTQPHGRFTGTIKWAQIDLGDDDHNHLIPPEAHLQAAMTHQ